MRSTRVLYEVLQSVSDVVCPDSMGERQVKLNSRSADGNTPPHVLASRNDPEGAAILVEAGADVNAQGDMGEIPLHVAVGHGSGTLLALLLRADRDPGIRSELGVTSGGTCRAGRG